MTDSPWSFQDEDVAKIGKQLNGAIGSEMGTGKTYEAIRLDANIWNPKGKKPTLIVAPLNTFDGWQEKYGQLAPSSDLVVIDRKNRERFADDLRRRRGDVFVVHWDALRLMPELGATEFGVVVADEVHRAANRKAQATQALKQLKAEHKLGMSGTMPGDQPQNLWSIYNWLWPTYYRSYWAFYKHYCQTEHVDDPTGNTSGYTKVVGVKNAESLIRERDPWWVRHLKREPCCPHHPQGVMPWLPKKTYDTIWVDLSPTQHRIYEQMRKEMVAWVGAHEGSPLVASAAIAQLTRLSQIALATPDIRWGKVKTRNPLFGHHPDQEEFVLADKMFVDLHAPSAKISAVTELLKDHSNKQFLVMSASKQACYLAQQMFASSGITSQVFSGDTTDLDRERIKRGFLTGNFQVFIGVIEAMAEGVDGLQYATDTGIFLDRSWKTVKNFQAEDRLDRGGQTSGVNIIDVMARGTLDFGRNQRLVEKWSWIKTILGDPYAAQQMMLQEAA